MAHDAKTEFYYYINGKPYLLTPAQDGITEEIITVLRDSYHAEHLHDRYEEENKDPKFECANLLHGAHPQYPESPIDRLDDSSQSPEALLFSESLPQTFRDRIHELIPHLIPAQQELYWKLCEGQKLVDIAREEGTTDNAIRSRRNKMISRIRTLFSNMYGDGENS